MADYRVVGSVRSRTLRVLWALEELGLRYEHDPAPPRSETIIALNPSGKVPALVADGTVLTDSVAIVQYLADRHGAGPGGLTHAAGTLERGLQDGLTQFVIEEVDGPLWTAAKHRFVLPEELRVPQVKETARAEFARAMDLLARRLDDGRPYLTGETFTVPDLILGHCAGWAQAVKFEVPDGPVRAHAERARARPALSRAMRANV